MNKQFLLTDVGNDFIGQTRTFVTVQDSHPVGSFSVRVSTTYSKARDPHAHLTRLTLHLDSKAKLKDLALFLAQAATL